MAKNTKEKILNAALEVFARDGYAGTNIKDIADSVGIVKSALYRHFSSKEEIWSAVCKMMIDYYAEKMLSAGMVQRIPKSTDELIEITEKMVDFTVHDARVIQMRKIIITEQFRSADVRNLANQYFLYSTEATFEKVFSGMMDNGTLKKNDPRTLAFSYTAPITTLIHLCDRDPSKETEAMEQMQRFIRMFVDTYENK